MARSGRPATLSRARIIDAVVDLLEANGSEPITTRTVGDVLGVHPTALYRHFRDMDELLREAADRILVAVLPPVDTARHRTDPLAEVQALCLCLRTTLMAHPGAARVMAPGPSRGPNERAFTERLLALLSESGLSEDDTVLAYHALVEFVVGSAAIDTDARAGVGIDHEARYEQWRADYATATADDFPHTVRLAAFLYPSQDDQFAFGLGLLIESLRARVGNEAARDGSVS